MNKFMLKDFNINFYNELVNHLIQMSYPFAYKKYEKKQAIFIANTECNSIGIITKGSINIEHDFEDGRKVIINNLHEYDIFGEILIFSHENLYPYHIISNTKTEVLFIHKDVFLQVLEEDKSLLEKFLFHLSKSYLKLNKYIKLMSQKTIINKLSYYLLHYQKITESNRTCYLSTKTELADFLGVERQSLIRELNKLKEKKIINYDKDCIYVLDFFFLKKHIN